MKATSDRIERSQVVLNVEVDPEEMHDAVQQAYRRVGAKVAIPGFRKGKAPAAILEQFYGREALIQEAAEHLLPEVYNRALEQNDVDAIAQPEVEILQTDPLVFKATVPVRPTVDLGDCDHIRFVPEPVEVTDAEVDEAVENLRYHQAPWEPVERAAQSGDLLAIDVLGTVDGETVIDEKGGVFHLSTGSSRIPGFAEQLEGAEKGEEREFTLELPEGQGEYVGKECSFKVAVNEIKAKNLPELDDEFAKGLGKGMETLAELKQRIEADLKARKEYEARSNIEEKSIKALVDQAQVEYPEVLLQRELDHLVAENRQQFGGPDGLESYLNSISKTEEEFRAELMPMAERIVLRSLVLQKFAELEGIEVGMDEVRGELEHLAEHAAEDRVRQFLSTTAAHQSVGRNLFMRKALDRLYEVVTAGDSAAVAEDQAESTEKEEEGQDEDATQ
jgi:trigger factor